MKTYDFNEGKIVEMAGAAYYFTTNNGRSAVSNDPTYDVKYAGVNSDPDSIGNYKYVPEGVDNLLPLNIRELLESSNLGPGILGRQRGLQIGQGPHLYREIIEKEAIITEWVSDPEVEEWMASWDCDEYSINTVVDLLSGNIAYTKLFLNKGLRVQNAVGKIAKLEHMVAPNCRREWPDSKNRINNILIGDWENNSDILAYPRFDRENPFKKKVTADFTHIYQWGRGLKDPIIPSYYGGRKWMRRSAVTPDVLDNLSNNSLNIKYHIKAPKAYWDKKEEALKDQMSDEGKEYKASMLEKLKEDTLADLSAVLSGVENVGKFFYSETVATVLDVGQVELEEWKIEVIDMKISDFVKSQIEISNKADGATTSSMLLHPALSNILIDGELPSGSEQLYAYKIFIATDTWTINNRAFKIANAALKANWPDKDIRIGFYHDIVRREQEITSADRVVENTM